MLDLRELNSSWTIFLDRDGVINHEKVQDYIYHFEEFIFYEGALDAIRIFTGIFHRIILVTNQRGIGKGLMTEKDLHEIHNQMLEHIRKAGGRIDGIYYNTSINNDDPFRKPQTGMALMAQKDFPEINFSHSIVVGNNISDMLFGRNAGMHTVFLKTTQPVIETPNPAIDLVYPDLQTFAKALQTP